MTNQMANPVNYIWRSVATSTKGTGTDTDADNKACK